MQVLSAAEQHQSICHRSKMTLLKFLMKKQKQEIHMALAYFDQDEEIR